MHGARTSTSTSVLTRIAGLIVGGDCSSAMRIPGAHWFPCVLSAVMLLGQLSLGTSNSFVWMYFCSPSTIAAAAATPLLLLRRLIEGGRAASTQRATVGLDGSTEWIDSFNVTAGSSNCEPFVRYGVLLVGNQTQEDLALSVAPMWGGQLTGRSCQYEAWKLACVQSYPEAYTIPGTNVTVAKPLCRSLCTELNAQCHDDVHALTDWLQL